MQQQQSNPVKPQKVGAPQKATGLDAQFGKNAMTMDDLRGPVKAKAMPKKATKAPAKPKKASAKPTFSKVEKSVRRTMGHS